ncbi:MAG: hypothetical protein AAF066_20055, partial [Pseudomonadota bacterium]
DRCNNLVECAQAMMNMTNRLVAENAALQRRLVQVEQGLRVLQKSQGPNMRRGGARVEGSGTGYRETTIIFNPPFRKPPAVFLSAREVNSRDHQQLWVKAVTNDRAIISNCRRHVNPEGCLAYADDFYFDWIAVRR